MWLTTGMVDAGMGCLDPTLWLQPVTKRTVRVARRVMRFMRCLLKALVLL
jgi:hypothetical protein